VTAVLDRRQFVYQFSPRLFLSYLFFNNSCQTNYLKIYRADLRQIFTFGGTTAGDDQSEVSFSIRCRARDFFGLSTEMIFITPVASGAVGQANVGFCFGWQNRVPALLG